jgi:Amt family ammonium transporter
VFSAGSLGGIKDKDYSIGSQVLVQIEGVVITMVVSAIVAFIAYKIVDMVVGLRVSEEDEREGLDISSHGETAYNR